jgi:antitoxin (DNA-binding transcriptional repressor) of toxin-antitoxin stability system
LIKSAQAGEDVVIANRGKPVARLVAVNELSSPSPKLGSGRLIVEWIQNNPLPRYAQRTAEEIDADIEAERASWD